MSDKDNHNGGGLKGLVDKAQDMMGGVVGMASAETAGRNTEAFVTSASIGDLYEIEAGRIAAVRGRSEEVRMLGAMMVEHHTTSMHQMQSALMSSETPDLPPTMALDERRQGMIDNLQAATDDAFDGRYLDQQRMSHQETLTLLKGYAEHGDNPQFRSVAVGGLPMVERHLKMITASAGR
jgi:putative membrane protein